MSVSVVGSRATFGSYLRELRKRKSFESPAELARRMGGLVSVSGILKRERGELKITRDYVDAFAKAVQASPEEQKFLRQHLDLFLLQFDLWRAGKSIFDINLEAAARLEESREIHCFSPTLIPHVVQTAAYTRAILETYQACEDFDELEQTILVRSRTAERIRQESHRRVHLINLESALYNIYGGPEVMRKQLSRLLEIGQGDQVQYRIVPLGTNSNLPTDSTFTIHDGLFVTAESTIGNLYTGDKDKATWAASKFSRLWSVAVTGKQSRMIIERAMAHLKDNI
jgi:transcriptional regulator with XRE-family HTH domain